MSWQRAWALFHGVVCKEWRALGSMNWFKWPALEKGDAGCWYNGPEGWTGGWEFS
jgi:hypothetical protein